MKFLNKIIFSWVISILHLQFKSVELLISNESYNTDFREFSDYYDTQKFSHLTIHRDTGIVYISAVNRLYQLSPDLQLQSNISNHFSQVREDDYNKILLIDYWQPRLITCGHLIDQLPCITYSTKHTISESNRKRYKMRKFGASLTNQTRVFFMSLNMVGLFYQYTMFVTTKTEIFEFLGISREECDDDECQGVQEFSNKYTTDFVYGFKNKYYNYFLSILDVSSVQSQPKSFYVSSLQSTSWNLPRCNVIKIECGFGNEQNYNLAQAAYAAGSRNVMSDNFELFAVFTKRNDTIMYPNEHGDHSALCVYSLNKINEKLMKKECVIDTDTNEVADILENCVITSPPAITFNAIVTAISTVENENYTEVFIGTYDGHIKMIIVENATMAYEQVDITIEEGSIVNSDLLPSPDKQYLYVMTEHRIVKIKIPRFNCSMLTNYDDCMKSNNNTPHCGWCVFTNKCTIKHHCDQIDNYSTWIRTDFREKIAFRVLEPTYSNGHPQNIRLESLTNTFDGILFALTDLNCKISFVNTELTLTVITSISHENVLAITCKISEINQIQISQKASIAKLSLQTANIQNIWGQNITFFNCSAHLSNKECIFSNSPCYWCSMQRECMHYNEEKKAACPNGNVSEIISFIPQLGPCEGSTIVTIQGQNLDVPFNSTYHIKIAGGSCKPYKNTTTPMKKIECIIEQSTSIQAQEGPIEIYIQGNLRVKSQQNFQFVNPEIDSFYPNEGPTNGGTELTIKGKNLNVGRNIEILIGKAPCEIFSLSSREIKCIINSISSESFDEHSNFTMDVHIGVKFDNNIRNPPENVTFKLFKDLEHDDRGFNLVPKGILSGGVEIIIQNVNSTQIQQLSFHVHNDDHIFNSSCKIYNDSSPIQTTIWSCKSPPISNISGNLIDAKNPRKMKFSLRSNETHNSTINMPFNYSSVFFLYPDPEFHYYFYTYTPVDEKNYIIIRGEHINSACQKSDIAVQVGNDTCKVLSVSLQQVTCLPQKSQPESYIDKFEKEKDPLRKNENVTVLIGEHFKRIVPKHKKKSTNSMDHETGSNNLPIIVIVFGASLCIISMVSISLIYYFLHHRAKSSQETNSRAMKEIQKKMNKMCMETIALKQCVKQVIIENQIDLDENSSSILKLPNITIVNSTARIDVSSDVEYQLYPIDHKWEFPRENISLGKCLGQGEFGKVVQAEAIGILQKHLVTTVAIKMLKDDHSDSDMIDLVSEMEILKLIGQHDNVLQMLGCCTQNGDLLIITEFARYGNLQDFLRNHAPLSGDKFAMSNLSQEILVGFTQQIAKGMEYLASKKCIHRDLAARNVLVYDDYTLKVADFGLARDIRNKEYYRKETRGRLPLKWMAPEALIHGLYSVPSDVWSYGVLLWEIFTSGGKPYPTLLHMEELFEALGSGYRMGKPPNCSVQMYSLMQKCWSYLPEDRPSFTTIVQYIENILPDETTFSQQ